MGFIGGAIDAFSGNQVNVTHKVKNPELQKYIDQLTNRFGSTMNANDAALRDFENQYLASTKDASVRSTQEIAGMDKFYNGDMANQLAQLRSSRTAALTSAADRASKYALANMDRSRLNDGGGGSSYNLRLLSRNVGDIQSQAAVDEQNQARADLGYVTGNQNALAGKRNQIATAQAGYGLVPSQMRDQMYQQNLGMVGGLTQLDQANKFYGLKQDRSQWADFADAADQGILNAASIYSSVGGGGMKDGGKVKGPGTETSDSIPVRLSDGEFVVRAAAVKMPGVRRALEIINALGEDDPKEGKEKDESIPHYRHGGMVRMPKTPPSIKAPAAPGYADGGMVGSMPAMGAGGMGDWMGSPYGASFWGGGSNNAPPAQVTEPAAPQKKSSKSSGGGGGGGGGGGLSGQAMALQAREDRSTGPGQYMPDNLGVPAMVPAFGIEEYLAKSAPSFWGNS